MRKISSSLINGLFHQNRGFHPSNKFYKKVEGRNYNIAYLVGYFAPLTAVFLACIYYVAKEKQKWDRKYLRSHFHHSSNTDSSWWVSKTKQESMIICRENQLSPPVQAALLLDKETDNREYYSYTILSHLDGDYKYFPDVDTTIVIQPELKLGLHAAIAHLNELGTNNICIIECRVHNNEHREGRLLPYSLEGFKRYLKDDDHKKSRSYAWNGLI